MPMRSFICVLLRRHSSEPPPMSLGSAEVYLRTDRAQAAGTSCPTTRSIKTARLSIGWRRGGNLFNERGGSLFNELGCFLRVRYVSHMAGIHFDRLGIGALRHHTLLVRIDRPVCGGHHVPGALGLPCGLRDPVAARLAG